MRGAGVNTNAASGGQRRAQRGSKALSLNCSPRSHKTAELLDISVGTIPAIRQRIPNMDDCASEEEQRLQVKAELPRQRDTSVNRKRVGSIAEPQSGAQRLDVIPALVKPGLYIKGGIR